jgi:glycosyltransferase involved in cell wall biosynthesis
MLIQAFNQLQSTGKSLKLYLYGRVPGTDNYGKKILELVKENPNILIQGPYDNHKVFEILSGLDCLVIPSIWFENRPTVIIEALAARTPVIASKIGGIPEIVIHEKNGLLFEYGNIDDLRTQLQRLIDEPELLGKLRNGIEPVYPIEVEMDSILSIYQDLLLSNTKQ